MRFQNIFKNQTRNKNAIHLINQKTEMIAKKNIYKS